MCGMSDHELKVQEAWVLDPISTIGGKPQPVRATALNRGNQGGIWLKDGWILIRPYYHNSATIAYPPSAILRVDVYEDLEAREGKVT